MGALHLQGTILPAGGPRDLFIADGRITFDAVDDAVTISAGGWITPGLVDAHAHLAMASPGSPATVEEAVRADQIDPGRADSELKSLQESLSSMRPEDPAYEANRARVERAAARAFVANRR